MNFVLIDYSALYFKETLPPVRGGKFVLIHNLSSYVEYLVFSPKELSFYHADIVAVFSSSRNISGQYNPKKDYFKIHDPVWHVSGGGKWLIDETARTLRLSGTSIGYGTFNPDGLKRKILTTGLMTDYDILIN